MPDQKKLVSIRQSIGSGKKFFEQIAAEQNNKMVWAKESGFAMQAIEASDYLQKCPIESFKRAIVNVASIGLSLNPAEKLAYLVPRDGKACLDISYRGLVKIATDSGSIVWAKAMLVHEEDNFEFTGVDTKPIHIFPAFAKPEDRGPIIGGYSIAKLHNGDYLVDSMTIAELDEIRDTSKAKNGPWKTWPNEMKKKSLLRRGSKSWPTTQRFMEAEAALNEHQGLTSINVGEAPAQAAVVVISDEQIKELNKLAVDSHLNVQKIYTAFEIEKIEDLPVEKFAACKARLTKALNAYNKKQEAKKEKPND